MGKKIDSGFYQNIFSAKKNNFIPSKKTADYSDGLDIILYVPLHKKKLRTRGFDQAFLIAKEMSH